MADQYNLEAANKNLNIICNCINQGVEVQGLSDWLKHFHTFYNQHNIVFLGKVFPKLETVSDLIQLNEYLKKQLAKLDFIGLSRSFKMARDQTINYNGNQIRPFINITVKRKTPIYFCLGKTCVEQAIRYNLDELFSLQCCNIHKFCKNCIKSHIDKSLIKNPYQPIGCEACLGLGLFKSDDPNSAITKKEIQSFFSQKDLIEHYQNEAEKRFLVKCNYGLRYCPNKDNFLKGENIVQLNCIDKPCKDCFALYIIEYINEITSKIINDPLNFAEKNIFIGIMCRHRHVETLKKYTCEELAEILNVGSVTQQLNMQTVEKYRQFKEFFDGCPFYYCKNCKKVYLKKNNDEKGCNTCRYCISCQSIHPNIDCRTFQEFKEDSGEFGDTINGDDDNQSSRIYKAKVYNILKENKLDNYKLALYRIITPGKLIQYKHDELLKTNPDFKALYIFSDPLLNQNEIDNCFYNPIKNLEDNRFFELNSSLKNEQDSFWVLIYKLRFIKGPIIRRPNLKDIDNELALYTDRDKCYFSKEEMALPYLIAKLEKI